MLFPICRWPIKHQVAEGYLEYAKLFLGRKRGASGEGTRHAYAWYWYIGHSPGYFAGTEVLIREEKDTSW